MKKKSKKANSLGVVGIIIFAFLVLYTISVMFMYVWAFYSSIKTKAQFNADALAFPKGWPWEWAWDNYLKAIVEIKVRILPANGAPRDVYMGELLFNSLIYAIGGALVNNFTMWVVAYICVRFSRYKFSGFVYAANLVFMMLPILGNLASALAIFKALGWYDNYSFIIFNNISFIGTYFLIYYGFIRGLGPEYYESAYMDGAGNFTIMTKIVFPLTVSMFVVVLLMFVIERWNDYMTMVIWMPSYPTIAYGIYKVGVSSATIFSIPNLQITVCMILMLPMLLLFFIFQKPIMGNLRLGAIKG